MIAIKLASERIGLLQTVNQCKQLLARQVHVHAVVIVEHLFAHICTRRGRIRRR